MIFEVEEESPNRTSGMQEDPMEEFLRELDCMPAPKERGEQTANEDQDKVPNLLLDMPEEPMKEILGNLDFIAIQTLRKVCHPMRNFIDEQNIDPKFPKILVTFGRNEIKLSIYHESFVFSDGTKLIYKKTRGGTKVIQKMFEFHHEFQKTPGKILKNTNFVDIFCRDFQILTEKSKTISSFLFLFKSEKLPKKFIRKLQNILKLRNFMTDFVRFEVHNSSQILPFLPLFDAQFLNSLTVDSQRTSTTLDMNTIKDLEQWKKLEEVRIENFNVGDSKIFTHLTMGSVSVSTMTADDINHLLQSFRHSPNLSKMKFEVPVSERRQIMETLGDDYIEDIDNPDIHEWTRQWLFRMPNDENYVLKVEVYSFFVVFERLEREYLSADRIVKE